MQGSTSREMLQAQPSPDTIGGSPRKRRRSPHEVANAKVQKFGNGNDFDHEDDLDLICTAALEDFEQTQRESPNNIPSPSDIAIISKPQIPVANSISANSISAKAKPSLNAAESPFLSNVKVPTLSQPVASRFNVGKGLGANSSQAAASVDPAGGGGMEEDRIKFLQEQNYTKDGEVKLLRTEKERLIGEMRQMRATLLAEKQAMEKQLTKERDALATQLQFKEQDLQEKCALLEQRPLLAKSSPGTALNRSQPQKTTPSSSSSSRTPVLTRASAQAKKGVPVARDGKQTEFISSETFMPLSQLNSGGGGGLTPIRIGPRHGDGSAASRGRGQTKAAARSRSISPNPSDLKKMKKRSVSDKGNGNSPQGMLEFSETGGGRPTAVLPISVGGVAKGVASLESAGEALLPAPNRELDGAQILLLLVNQNLLRPPHVEPTAVTQGVRGSSSWNLNSHLSLKEEEKVRGLLSLLHIETKASMPSFPPVVESYTTPTTKRCDDFAHLQRQSSDSDQSCSSTPTRRSSLLPHPRAHTLGRTNLAKSRIRHSSGLLSTTRRPYSTTNTPIKAPLATATDSASISLLSSINPDSLNKNIGNLLVSSEVTRFDSFTNRSKGSLLSSVVKSRSSDSPDPVTEILKQIGQIITSYHRDQLKMATKTSSCNSYESSESAVDSLLFSPKSSTTGSRTGSDLSSPLPGDQLLVARALEILEVLVTYSTKVREQILLQPPEFIIDSRPSSSLGLHQNSPFNVSLEGVTGGRGEGPAVRGERETNVPSSLAEVSHRLTVSQQQDLQTGESSGMVSSSSLYKIGRLISEPYHLCTAVV